MNRDSAVTPSSPLIEAAVLGMILTRPVVLDDMPEGVELFHYPYHRALLPWLIKHRPQGDKPFELEWICQRIDDAGDLELIGGAAYLNELVGKARPSRLTADIEELRDKRARRIQITAAQWAIDTAQDPMDGDFLDAMVLGTAQVAGALEGVADAPSNTELIGDSLERFHARLKGEKSPMGLPTIPEIDYLLKGLHPKRVWVIGAYPGGGKSVIASQIITDLVLEGTPAVFLTLEMQESDQIDRMMIQASRVSSRLFTDPRREEYGQATLGPAKQELVQIRSAAARLQASPLRVQRPGSRRLGVVIAALRRANREMGAKVGVVDYLQLVQVPSSKGQTREDEMKQISHALAEVANETGMHLIILSQLNADGETKHGRVIEEDADAFITIDQERNRASETFKQHLGMTVVKDRFNGNAGRKIPLVFDSDRLRFVYGHPPKKEVKKASQGRYAREFSA